MAFSAPGSAPRTASIEVLGPTVLYTLWGIAIPFVKLALRYLPPTFLAGWRFFLGAVILGLIILLTRRKFRLPRHKIAGVLTIGVVLFFFSNALWFNALNHIHGTTGSLFTGLNPIMMAILSMWWLKEESLTFQKLFGFVLGFTGVALMSWEEQKSGAMGLVGVILAFFACLTWSGGLVGVKALSPGIPPMVMNFYQMLTGGILLILLSFMTDSPDEIHLAPQALAFLAVLIGVSTFNFTAFAKLSQRMDAHKIGVYNFIVPLAGGVGSLFLLGEQLRPIWVVSLALVVSAVVLVTWERGRGTIPVQ